MAGLSDKVRCKVSGFEGIITGRTEYLNGCIQLLVNPRCDKDGKPVDGVWIDEQQLEVLEYNAIDLSGGEKPIGGPQNSPPGMPHP